MIDLRRRIAHSAASNTPRGGNGTSRWAGMNWFCVAATCPSIADFSWLVGALAGGVFDTFLIIAIALTPPLREHGGDRPPMGAMQRYGLYLAPALIVLLWLGGLCLGRGLINAQP